MVCFSRIIRRSIEGELSMAKNEPDRPEHDFPKTGNPATNALLHAGYTRLEQLTKVPESEIAALHGMGPKALKILRATLEAKGWSFAPEPEKKKKR
jgi:hypothetical protein